MTRVPGGAVLTRVIVALLAVGLLTVGLRATKKPDHSMIVTADFARSGLNIRPGYEVRVRDLPVGKIKAIDVDKKKAYAAKFVLKLDPGVAVAKDTKVAVIPKTLFGDKYLQLDPAAPGQPRLQSGDRIDRAHTVQPVEFQDVLDRLTPALEALGPEKFAATLAAVSQSLTDQGVTLSRLTDGWVPFMQEMTARQGDTKSLLTNVPGVAGTFAERSGQLATAANDLGDVAATLAKDEPALGKLLRENAELARQTADLLTDQPARLGRILPDMVDVVRIMDEQPNQIGRFAKSFRYNLRGTANIMSSGWIQTRVTNTFIINWGTLYDAPGGYGDYQGGTGVTPDIYIKGMPNQNIPIDLSPKKAAAASSGLDKLFVPVAGATK